MSLIQHWKYAVSQSQHASISNAFFDGLDNYMFSNPQSGCGTILGVAGCVAGATVIAGPMAGALFAGAAIGYKGAEAACWMGAPMLAEALKKTAYFTAGLIVGPPKP